MGFISVALKSLNVIKTSILYSGTESTRMRGLKMVLEGNVEKFSLPVVSQVCSLIPTMMEALKGGIADVSS